MAQRPFEIVPRQPSVFARDALGARSFAIFDGLENLPVVLYRDGGNAGVISLRIHRIAENGGSRFGERQRANALEGALQWGTLGQLPEFPVEGPSLVHVNQEAVYIQGGVPAGLMATAQRLAFRGVGEAFRGPARGGPFEQAAKLSWHPRCRLR